MFRLARIAPLDGDATVLADQPDGGQQGWLRVVYKGEYRWARPCYAFGRFTPPSAHWVRKYAGRLGVWVIPMAGPVGEELEDFLVYVGFAPLEGGTQPDVVGAFPERKLFFSERWELVVDDTAAAPSVTFRYVGDPENDADPPADPGAVTVKFSQEPGAESIWVDHIVDGAPIGTNLLVDKDGTVTINVHKDVVTVVEGNTDTRVKGTETRVVDKKRTLTFNDELVAEVVKQVTATLDDKLVAEVKKEVTLTLDKKVTATLKDELEAEIDKKVTATLQAALSATVATTLDLVVANVSKLSMDSAQAVLQAASVAKATLAASSFKVELGADSLKVVGASSAAVATVGDGSDAAVAYTPFDILWGQLFSIVMLTISTHTHDVTTSSACTAGGSAASGTAAVSSALSGITSPLPTISVKSGHAKFPLG